MPIFVPSVLSFSDYYPFGMMMPNRHKSGSSNKYRYGFNGQEKDDDVAGEGNSYTAMYWQYDPRIAKRWNPNPVVKYHESRYAVFANNPLRFVDRIGKDTLSVVGKNGSMVSFIHKDLEKRKIELPFALNLDQNISLNFDETGAGTLPDVLGYSITGSFSGTAKRAAYNLSGSKSFVLFTRGKFLYNPFPYSSVGVKSGFDLNAQHLGASFSGTISFFGAYMLNAGSEEKTLASLTPESWTKTFQDVSIGATGFSPMGGGGLSLSGFQTPGVLDGGKGYLGFSLDITVGLGVGTDEGTDISVPLIRGKSYFFLDEFYPEPTLKLMNSTIGRIRLKQKWDEFMSGQMYPYTKSDMIKIIGDVITSPPPGRHDYTSPTFLNGYFGSKL